jgi:hypothetical protein
MSQHRDDLIVLLVMIGGFLLNIYAPLWLAPPLFEYTIWLYVLLFFAWVPVYTLLMRGKRRGRLMVLFVLVAALVTSCAWITIRPRSAFGNGFLDRVECAEQPADEGRVRYACTRVAFEGPEFNRTWLLEGLAGLPVIWVVRADGW